MQQPFLIHNHSEYSNLRLPDCNIKLPQLIDEAVNLGLKGIAITDHECISGHIVAIQKAKELKEKGIDFKIGLGNEIYLVNSLEEVKDNYTSGVTKFPHFVLVAKTKRGHEALRKLSTKAWGNSFKTGRMERVVTEINYLKEIMKEYRGEIIASSACLGSYIGIKYKEYVQTNNKKCLEEINTFIYSCKDMFGEDFYLEIQPSFNEEQIGYNKLLVDLSNKLKVKIIYSTDTHYLRLEKKKLHKSFLQSKEGEREVDDFYGTTYMMTYEELYEYFKRYISKEDFNEYTNNTLEISNKIEFYDLKQDTIVPQVSVPPFNQEHGMKYFCNEYEYIGKYYYSEHLIDKYLLFMLVEGMKERKQYANKQNLERINSELKELWLISDKLHSRLSSYYLLVQEVVNMMWTVSLVGIARGSGTGFYLCYLLGITQMNPMEFGLCSWRHIHHSRIELPKQYWVV